MSNRLDMKKDTNNRKDKTKYDGPEKPDAYMGNDKQWVFRALVLAFIDMCIIAISFFFALMIRFEFSYSHIPLSFLEGYLHIVPCCALRNGNSDFTCGVLYFQAISQHMALCEHQ